MGLHDSSVSFSGRVLTSYMHGYEFLKKLNLILKKKNFQKFLKFPENFENSWNNECFHKLLYFP
jgi:hypothetical protein